MMDSASEQFNGGLTVLMAVYKGDNHCRFSRAIDSVFQNSLKPDQMILVVDGAVSEEIESVIQHAVKENGLKVVRLQHNQGLAKALNEGLKFVQTEWIARADADDINMPDRFACQHQIILANPDLDLVGGAIEEVEEDGRLIAFRRVPETLSEIRNWIPRRNPFNHMTVLARTSVVRSVGGYPDLYRKEDYGLWARIIAGGGKCMNSNAILVRASAGKKMYGRRGGLGYVKSEFFLQRELIQLRISSLPTAFLNGAARALIFLMPVWLKEKFYLWFLRDAPQTSMVEQKSCFTNLRKICAFSRRALPASAVIKKP
jgi:glycosyltransferase involved in cell wall biosynthesis